MAGGKSGRGAFWLGALLGLAVSAALAVALSVLTPLNSGSRVASVGGGDVSSTDEPQPQSQPVASEAGAAAPTPQVTTAPASPAAPTPEPEPSPTVASEATAPEPSSDQVALAPQPAQPSIADEEEAAPAPAPSVNNSLPPFKANSEIYNGDRSQPLLSIVLISDPADRALLDELLLLPGPLSVVVPPDADDVRGMILDVRDAGFEALLGLDAARAGDAAARVASTNEVIGVALLGEEAGGVADGVVPLLRDGGLALLDATADGGSAPFRAARSSGVPAAPKGRVFDDVQSSAMVFQALERAAFDARRTGAFVVIGDAHPAVLTGLRRWMNVKANKSVNVAPLSVVIDKVSRQ